MNEKVKVLVDHKLRGRGIDGSIIKMCVDEAEQVILNYCNITEVPAALNFTWANMACDIVKSFVAEETGEPINGTPASLTMGDTTISLNNAVNTTGHQIDMDVLVKNYKEQLQKFRRFKWSPI